MHPGIVLPSQHLKPRHKHPPEYQLITAVLHDALDCVNRTHGRRLFLDAKQWFLADERDWPYSFERIWEFLDLDSNAIRHHLGLAPTRRPVRASPEVRIARHKSGKRLEQSTLAEQTAHRSAGSS